jgi:hypothetical protein
VEDLLHKDLPAVSRAEDSLFPYLSREGERRALQRLESGSIQISTISLLMSLSPYWLGPRVKWEYAAPELVLHSQG